MLTNQHHHDYRILNAAKIKIKFQSRKRSNQKFSKQRQLHGVIIVVWFGFNEHLSEQVEKHIHYDGVTRQLVLSRIT